MSLLYGRLAADRPANTSEAELYACPASTEIMGAIINICNQTALEVTYRIALTDTVGSAEDEDWLVYDKILPANNTQQITAICMANPQTIRIQAGTADAISFVLMGLKKT